MYRSKGENIKNLPFTGKSTIVRALVDLLPPIDVVENDKYNSDPYGTNKIIHQHNLI